MVKKKKSKSTEQYKSEWKLSPSQLVFYSTLPPLPQVPFQEANTVLYILYP